VIAIHVVVPDNLSEEQRELAAKLAETLKAHNLGSRDGEQGLFSRVRRAFG
jgi:DnaJ-class molecular chaperone